MNLPKMIFIKELLILVLIGWALGSSLKGMANFQTVTVVSLSFQYFT
jgi:hypothetical protein